jgi:hypothetical protein
VVERATIAATSDVQSDLPVVELAGSGDDTCGSYRPGHNVHPTQARIAMEQPGISGTLVRTDQGVVFRPTDGNEDIGLRCHRPAALDEVLDKYGPADWRVSAGMLLNDHGVGISVACNDIEWEPCR